MARAGRWDQAHGPGAPQLSGSGQVIGGEDLPLFPPEQRADVPGHDLGHGGGLFRLRLAASGPTGGGHLLESQQVPAAHGRVAHHEAVTRSQGRLGCHTSRPTGNGELLEVGEGGAYAMGKQAPHEGASFGPRLERVQHHRKGAAVHSSVAGQRSQMGDGVPQQLLGGRAEGQRQSGGGVGGGRRIHEWRAIPIEHRSEDALDEVLVLLRPGDIALMGQQPVRQSVSPVQGRELLNRDVWFEMQERQGVVSAVPSEESGIAVAVRHMEGSTEGFDPVVAEKRGAAILQANAHACVSSRDS